MVEHDEKAFVYIFHNTETGALYVGSTKDEDERRRKHLSALRNGRHVNFKFQKAYKNNPNFDFVAIEVSDRETAIALEQSIIDEYYGSPFFLNLSADATYCNVKHSPESMERMRRALTGRRLTPEHREKMRQGQLRLNRTMSDEHKERLRNLFTGVPLSPEHKAKLSASGTARFDNPEERRKIGAAHVGKRLSQEHREKLSVVALGRKDALEKRRNMRLGNLYRSTGVVIDGVPYLTLGEAAEALGVHVTTITNRIKAGLYTKVERQESAMNRQITIWTMQLSKWRIARELGIYVLDCTARSGNSAFAPLFDNVMAYKRGELSEEEYLERYLMRMRQSRRKFPEEWEKLKTLSDKIALACYCKDGAFCHRHPFKDLLSDYLKDAQFEVNYAGELRSAIPPHVKEQT